MFQCSCRSEPFDYYLIEKKTHARHKYASSTSLSDSE
jgi:hypothetical protein